MSGSAQEIRQKRSSLRCESETGKWKDCGSVRTQSTHLIADVERVLDEVIFLKDGQIVRQEQVDDIREKEGMSVDELFRQEFRAVPFEGGEWNVK